MIKKFIKSKLKPINESKWMRDIYWNFIPEETSIIYDFFDNLMVDFGVVVDVGTANGSTFEPFANKGWVIYGFEPDSNNRKVVMERFKDKSNVTIDSRAVSNCAEKGLPFFRSNVSSGISGLSSFDASHRQDGTVDTTTLKIFCKEKNIEKIDFLKVDTEGFDLFVLQGFPWEAIKKPRLIMCEFEDTKTIPLGYNLEDIAKLLHMNGYQLLISEWFPVVKRGGPHKWKNFHPYGRSISDPNSWGNIIAVLGDKDFDLLNDMANHVAKRWRVGNVLSEVRKSIQKVFI